MDSQKFEKAFPALIEHAFDAILLVDGRGTIHFGSPFVERSIGHKRQSLVGRSLAEFVHGEDWANLSAALGQALHPPRSSATVRFRLHHKDGSWRLWEGILTCLPDAGAGQVIVNAHDITDRMTSEQQRLHDALHDALTSLPNRFLFLDRLTHTARRRQRKNVDHRFAVLLVDLDRFQVVNDSLGPSAGDELLTQVARRLAGCLRGGDTIARVGGDEFAILVDDIRDVTDATRVAERVHEKLTRPFQVAQQEVFATASIGITQSSTGYERPEDMLRDADLAMYRARAQAAARYMIFDKEMHRRAVTRLRLENDLRRALERGEFRLHYQPIYSLGKNEVSGFEALARWVSPGRGMILPTEFIPVAEETGLIVPLGSWVLRCACQQLSRWNARALTEFPLSVNVNVSSRQLVHADFAERLADILRETALDSQLVRLEITESLLMEGEAAQTILSKVRGLGVRVSIDDFGTGFSSLSYLHRLPVDMLKIDRSFVSGDEGLRNPRVVEAIMALAGSMGLEVTAEGIETAKQREHLQALGCHYGQGHLLCPPLDEDGAGRLIDQTPA